MGRAIAATHAHFAQFPGELWSAKTPRQSSSTVQEAVLVVKSVQDGVHHHAAGPIEVMPLALHLLCLVKS
jgi:hypothetical protein